MNTATLLSDPAAQHLIGGFRQVPRTTPPPIPAWMMQSEQTGWRAWLGRWMPFLKPKEQAIDMSNPEETQAPVLPVDALMTEDEPAPVDLDQSQIVTPNPPPAGDDLVQTTIMQTAIGNAAAAERAAAASHMVTQLVPHDVLKDLNDEMLMDCSTLGAALITAVVGMSFRSLVTLEDELAQHAEKWRSDDVMSTLPFARMMAARFNSMANVIKSIVFMRHPTAYYAWYGPPR